MADGTPLIGPIDDGVEEHLASRYSSVLENGTDDIIFTEVDQALSRRDDPELGNTDAGLDLPFVSYWRSTSQLADKGFNFPATAIGKSATIPNLGNFKVKSSNQFLKYEVNYWDTKLMFSADVFNVLWEETTKTGHRFPVLYPFYDQSSDTSQWCEIEYQYDAGNLEDNSVTARASEREGLRIRYTGELTVRATIFKLDAPVHVVQDVFLEFHYGDEYSDIGDETLFEEIEVP